MPSIQDFHSALNIYYEQILLDEIFPLFSKYISENFGTELTKQEILNEVPGMREVLTKLVPPVGVRLVSKSTTNIPSKPPSTSAATGGKVPPADEDRCVAVVATGENKGQRCKNKKSQGLEYCGSHSRTKGEPATKKAAVVVTPKVPPSSNFSIKNPPSNKPTMKALGNNHYKIETPQVGKDITLKKDGSVYTVVGIENADEGIFIKDFNDEQLAFIKEHGYVLDELEDEPAKPIAPPKTFPSIKKPQSGISKVSISRSIPAAAVSKPKVKEFEPEEDEDEDVTISEENSEEDE